MAQWLIADLSVADVHFQPWMQLVTGIVVFWFPLRLGNAVAFLEICIKFTAPAATASGE
jgi:hypothetical protein